MQLLMGMVLCVALGFIIGRGITKLHMKKIQEERDKALKAVKALTEYQKAAEESLQTFDSLLKRWGPQATKAKVPTAESATEGSVKDRLRRAVELTAQQNKIDRKKGPEFIMQHNELELEKLSVLKSIIADGFDPVITIRFQTGDEDMLLSNYIQSITRGLA